MKTVDFNTYMQGTLPIVGHEAIQQYLKKQSQSFDISHSYLFSGPPGIGKSTVAKYFAADLLSEIPADAAKIRIKIFEGTCSDVTVVKRLANETGNLKKNISIDQVRQLQQNFSLRTFSGNIKIAIIEDAEYLSNEAANALLKNLEEPAQKTVIILISSHPALLPATIVSRCSKITFRAVNKDNIAEYVTKNFKVKKEKARQFSYLSAGRPGRAITLATTEGYFKEYISQSKKFLSLFSQSLPEKFDFVATVASKQAQEVSDILKIWMIMLRDILLVQNDLKIFVEDNSMFDEVEHIAKKYPLQKTILSINNVEQAMKDLRANINSKLVLENLVLNFII